MASKHMKQRNKREQVSMIDRISTRRSKWGRMMELRVSDILKKMVEEGVLESSVYNEPNSAEDADGKDFTVRKKIDGKMEERSFGITISQKNLFDSQTKHPDVSQWWLPINTNDSTIEHKVLSLF